MNAFPSKELTLNFSIDMIKEKINLIIQKGAGTYLLKEKNDVFNTYRFAITKNLMVEYLSITLNKIDDENTKAVFQMAPPPGSVRPDTGLMAQMMETFLTLLSQALKGEDVTTQLVSKSNGCMVFFILILIQIILAIW